MIRSLYGAIKQIMETVLANKSSAFRECVLIEYPRKGIWTLGFITGTTKGEVQELTGGGGHQRLRADDAESDLGLPAVRRRREDIIRLNMSIEDGLKLVVSGGIVTPPIEATGAAPAQPDVRVLIAASWRNR